MRVKKDDYLSKKKYIMPAQSNTFVISYNLIEAFKNNSEEKTELLIEYLYSNSSQIRALLGNEVPDSWTIDDDIQISMYTGGEDDLSGSFSIKYKIRQYIGDGEDDDADREEDISFDLDLERSEITLTNEGV